MNSLLAADTVNALFGDFGELIGDTARASSNNLNLQ